MPASARKKKARGYDKHSVYLRRSVCGARENQRKARGPALAGIPHGFGAHDTPEAQHGTTRASAAGRFDSLRTDPGIRGPPAGRGRDERSGQGRTGEDFDRAEERPAEAIPAAVRIRKRALAVYG